MNNDKQFTPEERSIICSSCHGSGGGMLNNGDGYMECINCDGEPIAKATWSHLQYAAQQTAAKDEEIKQLKAGREKYATQKVKDACHDRDEIMRQLYKNEMAAKDERIKELEEHIALANVRTKVHINNELEKDARIAELEKLIIDISEDFKLKLSGYQTIEKQLHEKVKQLEKDALTWEHGCDKLIAERDQAFDLLEQVEHEESEWKIQRHKLLSSRENKRP